ncbi:AtpZ/AtpI family protein [Ahrensia sp. R2A130]|uniref:AtpZ/AtpI family protein n=1 Tax=Ahrensia sp. R2A130 TaxID=744979 RepID=UPI0001E0F050|nr:F0F1 ATP synthase assembly protein I [Ahrensia sp. R2A130]EFL90966.1 ATP synthase I [Ahrensia sp. R2A130]
MSDSEKPDDTDLDARLDSLRSRIDTKRPKTDDNGRVAAEKVGAGGIGQAMKLSSEFIAGIVVGAGLGYLFDQFFDTTPWGMIILLLLGFCAGILNVLRSAGMVAESEMRLRPAQEMARKSGNNSDDAASGTSKDPD